MVNSEWLCPIPVDSGAVQSCPGSSGREWGGIPVGAQWLCRAVSLGVLQPWEQRGDVGSKVMLAGRGCCGGWVCLQGLVCFPTPRGSWSSRLLPHCTGPGLAPVWLIPEGEAVAPGAALHLCCAFASLSGPCSPSPVGHHPTCREFLYTAPEQGKAWPSHSQGLWCSEPPSSSKPASTAGMRDMDTPPPALCLHPSQTALLVSPLWTPPPWRKGHRARSGHACGARVSQKVPLMCLQQQQAVSASFGTQS